jgi:hypothetical protein
MHPRKADLPAWQFAALLLCTAAAAHAQTTTRLLRTVGAEKPVEVRALDVRVLVHGLHAETAQTLTFYNPNDRPLEGALEFPLPPGATVSGFALDLGGELVEASLVPKEKARVALETEVRRGVDPALAEHVRGNLFRARVYPILARGQRTVRLRWVSELSTAGGEAAYHLPLPYDQPIGAVSVRVEVVRPPARPEPDGGFGNLSFTEREDRWVGAASSTNAAPARDLLVRLPRLPLQVVAIESGSGAEAFFAISDSLPTSASPALANRAPRRLALAWDASGSRTAEATERELAFLTVLLAAWPKTAVDLVLFRDRAEPPMAFETTARAQLASLLTALRKAPVDGGTALSSLDLRRGALPKPDDDLWLVCSDGLATLGEELPSRGDVPVWTVTGASVADHGVLRQLAGGGGRLLELVTSSSATAARALTHPEQHLLRATASPEGAVADLQLSPQADAGRASLTGRLLAPEADLTLEFGAGAVTERRTLRLRKSAATAAGDRPGPVATAWAQGRLEELSRAQPRDESALLALGRRFSLVTPGTSLLVLETLQQHLEHGVEPAASRADLRERYLSARALAEKLQTNTGEMHFEEVVRQWQARVAWWTQEHPAPPAKADGATRPWQPPQVTVQPGEGVFAGQIVDGSGRPVNEAVVILTSPSMAGEQTAVTDASGAFELTLLPAGVYSLTVQRDGYQPFMQGGFTIRRDLAIRVKLQLVPDTLMRDEVQLVVPTASAPTGPSISPEQMELVPYGRTSRNIGPVSTSIPGSHADLFGVSLNGAGAPETAFVIDGVNINDPAVGLQGTTLQQDFVREGANATPAPAAAAPVAPPPPPGSISLRPWDPQAPYLDELRSAAPEAAYGVYLSLRERYAGPAFFLDCAGLFLRAGQRALGLRILSNLAELRVDDAALLRVLAYRMGQEGELDTAAALLEKVLRLRPEEPQSRRDLALALAERAEARTLPAEAARAVSLLSEVVQRRWERFPEIELVALEELNRLVARAGRRGWSVGAERIDPRLRQVLDADLRVVLSWDADATDVDLHVSEPDGAHASFRNRRTRQGGLLSQDLTQGYGPEVYLLRRAASGAYRLQAHYYGSRQQTLLGPATAVATVFTNWGREGEERQVLTLRLDRPQALGEIGVVTIGAVQQAAERQDPLLELRGR